MDASRYGRSQLSLRPVYQEHLRPRPSAYIILTPLASPAMLIANVDDYGRNRNATDWTLECCGYRRVNAASAMVFIEAATGQFPRMNADIWKDEEPVGLLKPFETGSRGTEWCIGSSCMAPAFGG
jgi:hypothetical protein